MNEVIFRAEKIVSVVEKIKNLKSKLGFIKEGRHQDEFKIGYTREKTLDEFSDCMDISVYDLEAIRKHWKNELRIYETELEQLIKKGV